MAARRTQKGEKAPLPPEKDRKGADADLAPFRRMDRSLMGRRRLEEAERRSDSREAEEAGEENASRPGRSDQ